MRMISARLFAAVVGAVLVAGCGGGTQEPLPPNVVLLIADDLGWGDVSYHGSEIRTPHIDSLAQEGVELDRFYAAPNCSPTRMGLLTGRYPIRWGMMDSAVRPWETLGLPPEETTLAEILEQSGYRQRTLIGKWHVGHAARVYHPLEQGLSAFFGFYNGAIDYFSHDVAGQPDWHRDLEPSDVSGLYSTDLITDEAIRAIESGAAAEPFFLSVNYNAPHTPLAAPERCVTEVPPSDDGQRRLYSAVVRCLDEGIGRVLDAIDKAGIRDSTLVWFMSDNGGHELFGASNDPLRGQKLEVFEGGIRVPAVVRWPAGGLSGGRRVDSHVAYVDLVPTLQRILALPTDARVLDGIDVLDVLQGKASVEPREIFAFQGPNLVTGPEGPEAMALLQGDWKLVRVGPDPTEGMIRDGSLELFNVRDDPSEQRNLVQDEPLRVDQMLARLGELRALAPTGGSVLSPLTPPPGWRPPLLWQIP